MRTAKALMLAVLAATLFWSDPSAAGLENIDKDGWHTWQVDSPTGDLVQFYVQIEDGRTTRVHSVSWNCHKPTREEAIDHGNVSAGESFAWFRAVVEDPKVDDDTRDAALFGLVESGSDDAFEYIDRILSRHKIRR